MAEPVAIPSDYAEVLSTLKAEIRSARTRAALAINAELVTLYWRIGQEIAAREDKEGWGARVVDRLSADLKAEFEGMTGLSPRNLRYMRQLAEAWPDEQVLQRVVARLPWGHNVDLLDKAKDDSQRLFYAIKAIENDWTRKVLQARIASKLYEREGKALTNFKFRLPEPDAAAAQLITRDPYTFEFVELAENAKERDLERALVADLQKFLRELGAGFAFVGCQYHLEVDGEDFYIDLLVFHIPTSRYVVIDLKLDKFRPKDAGQINFFVKRRRRSAPPKPARPNGRAGALRHSQRNDRPIRDRRHRQAGRRCRLGDPHLRQSAPRSRARRAATPSARAAARGLRAHRASPCRGDGRRRGAHRPGRR